MTGYDDGGKHHKTATRLAHLGRDMKMDGGHPVNPPVTRASTILFDSLDDYFTSQSRRYEKGLQLYGRLGTETQYALEEVVADLEGGYGAVPLPSGLAAIVVTILAFVKAGDHVLVSDSVYAPNRAFCTGFLKRFGVETSFYDPLIGGGIAALLRPNTRVVFTESPGSMTFEVQDIPAIVEAAHAHGAVVAIDNTWATPLYFQPLKLGVDISVHAGTKYIVGHSDAMLGLAVCGEQHYERLRREAVSLGYSCSPDDAYLGLRGLRTLPVRLARHQESGLIVADWLRGRPEVARVRHPGLPGDPGHALWSRDFSGASGLFAIELQPTSMDAVAALTDGLELFGIGASWGGYESLVLPGFPERMRTAVPWNGAGPLLRLHIGLEDPQDLIADLAAGFERLGRAAAAT